jgi:hypothetical protein
MYIDYHRIVEAMKGGRRWTNRQQEKALVLYLEENRQLWIKRNIVQLSLQYLIFYIYIFDIIIDVDRVFYSAK